MSEKFVKKYAAALIILVLYSFYLPSSLSEAVEEMRYGYVFNFFVIGLFGLIPMLIVAGDIFSVPKGQRVSFLRRVFLQIVQWLKFWEWR